MSVESGWLSVAEAAEFAGVSERAIRRHLSAPENAARTRRETRRTATGTRQATVLTVELVEEIRRDGGKTPARNAAQDGESVANTGATNEKTSENAAPRVPERGENTAKSGETGAEGGERPANTGRNLAQVPDPTERLITALEAQIEELRRDKEAWRSQAEEANRNAAQATAALREYLRAQPKAITEGAATAPEAPQTRDNSPDESKPVEVGSGPQIAEKSQRRGFLNRILGR